MKKEPAIKYPHSAALFQFCRRVLDHKFGGIRVIDQDVGQILGFDPADCSHWKKGKKNIRSIQAMKAIADHLNVDDKLVVDIASGEMNDAEAFFEFTGYGHLMVEDGLIEKARKEFYVKNASTWTRDKENQFKDFFSLHDDQIDKIVNEIHAKVDFNEAPLYLPEIAAVYPDLVLKPAEDTEAAIQITQDQGKTLITFPAHEKMRPYIRYQIAKTMSEFFFDRNGLPVPTELGEYAKDVRDIQANLFAVKLLAPSRLIRKELANINIAKDLVTQLSEIFWVSKAFMNHRLREILERGN